MYNIDLKVCLNSTNVQDWKFDKKKGLEMCQNIF